MLIFIQYWPYSTPTHKKVVPKWKIERWTQLRSLRKFSQYEGTSGGWKRCSCSPYELFSIPRHTRPVVENATLRPGVENAAAAVLAKISQYGEIHVRVLKTLLQPLQKFLNIRLLKTRLCISVTDQLTRGRDFVDFSLKKKQLVWPHFCLFLARTNSRAGFRRFFVPNWPYFCISVTNQLEGEHVRWLKMLQLRSLRKLLNMRTISGQKYQLMP